MVARQIKKHGLAQLVSTPTLRLLGVRVERDETFQFGAGRGVFHIYANEPKAWDLRLGFSSRCDARQVLLNRTLAA